MFVLDPIFDYALWIFSFVFFAKMQKFATPVVHPMRPTPLTVLRPSAYRGPIH